MWATFWGLFLAASLLIFAGLAIVVTVRGFGEARALLGRDDGQGDGEPADGSEDS